MNIVNEGVKSLNQVFFVFVHVALEDVLNWAKQSFKCISLNWYNSAVSLSLNTCLSHSILHQCDLSKVITAFVLEYFFGWSHWRLFLFSNKFSFCDYVESISLITLFYDIRSLRKLFFLQTVTELFLFIRVNFSQYVDFRQNLRIIFSFLGGRLLDNMVEGGPVQPKKFPFCFAFDGGSSWGIVHEG